MKHFKLKLLYLLHVLAFSLKNIGDRASVQVWQQQGFYAFVAYTTNYNVNY